MTLLLKSKTATQKEDSHHAWEFVSTFQELVFLIAYDITLDRSQPRIHCRPGMKSQFFSPRTHVLMFIFD